MICTPDFLKNGINEFNESKVILTQVDYVYTILPLNFSFLDYTLFKNLFIRGHFCVCTQFRP